MPYIDEIVPSYNLSNKDKETIKRIEKSLKRIKINNGSKKSNKKVKALVRSIHYSLSIEANSLSLNDVENVYNHNQVLGKKDEVQEVKNAIELYNQIEKYNWKKEKDLLKAHKLLMKYFNDDNGKYRNHGEGIKKGNEIVFYAPDSLLVPGMMNDLFKYINKNNDIHPLVLSSLFHYYFVYIHPFTDGNGRTARFWVTLMLKDYNEKFEYIPIEETLYKHQKRYYNSIEKCNQKNEATDFVRFMLKIIEETINTTIENTTQKTTQKISTTNRLLKLLNDNPKITKKELAVKLNISVDGVKYQIKKLIANGIIYREGSDRAGCWIIK